MKILMIKHSQELQRRQKRLKETLELLGHEVVEKDVSQLREGVGIEAVIFDEFASMEQMRWEEFAPAKQMRRIKKNETI